MHETSFYSNETSQSMNERQQLRIRSHGHYEIQSITATVNTSQLINGDSVEFTLEWGNRSTDITLQEIQPNIGKDRHVYIYMISFLAFYTCSISIHV